MSDDNFAAYEAKEARAAQLNTEILPFNKQTLFYALRAAGIAVVTIGFDGSSDDGCLQEPVGFGAENNELPIPTTDITVRTVIFETGAIQQETLSVRDYLDRLATALLDEKHRYWEDGDGAYGEFRFSVADRTIALEFNERYVSTHYSGYPF